MARATSSLPTPASPSISTGMVDLAARSHNRRMRLMFSEAVAMSRKETVAAPRRAVRRTSSSSASKRMEFLIETCRRSAPTGFTTKSKAPARMADTTASMELGEVWTITGVVRPRSFMRSSTPMPSRSGMTRSRIRQSMRGRSAAPRRSRAASPPSASSA